MSHKKDKERASNGTIFRDGKLVPKEHKEEKPIKDKSNN